MEVILKERAKRSIKNIAFYIFKKGYPETSIKFTIRLKEFALSLGNYPDKYPKCRHKSFAKRGFQCAIFEENYVFIYRISESKVFIHNIVHASRLR